MKKFGGKVLFLDRDDINTDEIIPARYLTENTKDALRPYLLEDLYLPNFDSNRDIKGKEAVVTKANFGCGSSREHAPWALEANGINIVIASSFARIFRQNMYNCGMLAVELPAHEIDGIFRDFSYFDTALEIDTKKNIIVFRTADKEKRIDFTLCGFERDMVEAGGWVNYTVSRY